MGENNDPIADAILNDRPLPQEQAPATEQQNQPPATEPANPPAPPAEPATDPAQPADPNTAPTAPIDKTAEPKNSNWISEAGKIAGIEFKTEEEVKGFFEKAKGYTDLQSKYDALNQNYESLKAQPDPFANEHIKKVNEMIQQGRSKDDIAAFEKINSVGELKDLQPLEKVKLALQLRDGLTPEEADIRIKSLYKLDEGTYDENIIADNKVALKLAANKDEEFLNSYRVKLSENPVAKQQEDYNKQIAEYTEKVSPIAKSIQEKYTAIKGVNLNGKTGEDAITIDLPISEESRNVIADLATQYAVANNIPLDEKGIKNINEYVENVLWIQNREANIIHIASETERRVRAEFNNPSSIDRGQDNPTDDSALAAKQQEEWVLANS